MIYDCFTFFNEIDLLEIRLNVLENIVDKFVIVEATKTHNNEEKPLYFEKHKDRFKEFEDKIIYIKVDTFPEWQNSWTYEMYQRNCIKEGLVNCSDEDIIMISDLDEIPNPEIVMKVKDEPGIKSLDMYMFYYYLNCLNVKKPKWKQGTKILSYKDFQNILDDEEDYHYYSTEEFDKGTTANKIRNTNKCKRFKYAGWHFSFLGGAEMIAKKIKSFSHQEYNKEEFVDVKLIEEKIKKGEDIFNRGDRYTAFKPHKLLPKYLVENQDKYSAFFLKDAAKPEFVIKFEILKSIIFHKKSK